jgi:hypothetical protein
MATLVLLTDTVAKLLQEYRRIEQGAQKQRCRGERELTPAHVSTKPSVPHTIIITSESDGAGSASLAKDTLPLPTAPCKM